MIEQQVTGVQRRERRIARPFPTSDFLTHTELALSGDDAPFLIGPTIDPELVAQFERSAIAPVLRLPKAPDDFLDDVELGADNLEVLVWIADGNLFETHVVARFPFSSYRDGDYPIDEFGDIDACVQPVRPRDAYQRVSWADGTVIGVAVVLREQRHPVPGTAWRKGTELTAKSFRFQRPPESNNQPPIEYWDEDKFEANEFHRKTMWHVQANLEEGQILDEWNLEDSPIRILMADGLAAAVAHNPRSPLSVALQKAVLADFIAEALLADRNTLVSKAPLNSILDRVFRLAEKEAGLKPDKLVSLAKKDDGRELRAYLQGGMGITAQFTQALMGVKS